VVGAEEGYADGANVTICGFDLSAAPLRMAGWMTFQNMGGTSLEMVKTCLEMVRDIPGNGADIPREGRDMPGKGRDMPGYGNGMLGYANDTKDAFCK
jgi:hypothetical protein